MGEIIHVDVVSPKRILTMELDSEQAKDLIQALIQTSVIEHPVSAAAPLFNALVAIREHRK